MQRPKISFSVSDIPLGVSINKQFQLAKDLNVDGVEVVIGYKSGITIKKLEKLSLKYNVPILSIHEPAWSFLGIYRDKLGFKIADYFKAKYIAHPSFVATIEKKRKLMLYDWLCKMGKMHNVEILLENLPRFSGYNSFKYFFERDISITSLSSIKKVCDDFGFGMTLDTSHLGDPYPHLSDLFLEVSPIVKNIHLSDFNFKKQHLALGKGDLEVKAFLSYLKNSGYNDFLTLEVPSQIFCSKKRYMEDIKNSISYVNNCFLN